MIDRKASRLTPESEQFLAEWTDGRKYIEAHTSGSTGSPKNIRLLKSDMAESAGATNRFFDIGSGSHLFLPLSTGYIAGKMMIVRADIAGCRITVENPSNVPLQTFCGDIDLMAVVPSQCKALIDNPIAQTCVRNLIVGGAPVSEAMERKLLQMPWSTYATYGMTETCSHVALRALGTDRYVALPGITFSTDSRQCLAIHAPAFSFRTLVTNDVVELLSPTGFRWLGRADNVINSGGVKLYPEQMERTIAEHTPYPVMVRRVPDLKWGEAPEVVIEIPGIESAPDERETIIAQVRTICERELPKEARHAHITIVSTLPRTSNGKLKRTL